MTTIAYRDGVLAADTQVNSGNGSRAGHIEKIGRAPGGFRWAFSGSTQMQEACVAWAEKREGNPPEIDGVFILILPNGVKREWWGKGWMQNEEPQAAWGSGEKFARGAMWADCDAADAVRAAIALDTDSGGSVSILED